MIKKKVTIILLSAFITLSTVAFPKTTVNAAVANGWQQNGTGWNYYINGSKATNWVSWNGKWYYLKSDGVMATGWILWNSKWYYLKSSGDMAASQWLTWNGKQYYLNASGDMAANTTINGWVVGADGAWNGMPQITTVNNIKGYVDNKEAQIDLKVRSAANLNGTIVGYLYNYDRIEILGTVVDANYIVWDKIMYNNSIAFVSDAYIQHYVSPPDNVVSIAKNISKQFEVATPNQIAGNFDGQGLSLGYLQWCIGQGTLQPILNRMDREYNSEMRSIFGTNYDSIHNMLLDTPANQIKWANGINDSTNRIIEPWYSQLVSLTNNQHFINIEADAEVYIIKQAMLFCDKYNLKTVRGFALAFDIVTQNGRISTGGAQIIDEAIQLKPNMAEKELLTVIANAVADSSMDTSGDIRSRKLVIVNGSGTVHGAMLYLDSNYGLSDDLWR